MKYVSLLVLLICMTSACKDKTTTEKINIPPSNSSTTTTDPIVENTVKLLQGKWISLNDKNVTIIIEGNTKIENVEGKPEGKKRYFEIADHCKNEAANGITMVKSKAKYISMQDVDICYYIVKLDKNLMTLNYIGRNTVLKYKKETANLNQKRNSPEKNLSVRPN